MCIYIIMFSLFLRLTLSFYKAGKPAGPCSSWKVTSWSEAKVTR